MFYFGFFIFYLRGCRKKNFNEEQLIIKDILRKLNLNKTMLDPNNGNKNVNFCFYHQLIRSYYDEMDKIRKNVDEQKHNYIIFGT